MLMKRIYIIATFGTLLLVFIALLLHYNQKKMGQNLSENNKSSEIIEEDKQTQKKDQNSIEEPIVNSLERITKKPFGIYITPENSPVSDERFAGYHTGTDFEVTAEEIGKEMPITTICEGEILVKNSISGYGGVIVQGCKIKSSDVTVLYGHLDLSSSNLKPGDNVNGGIFLANLGNNKSRETDGERKHLHLGIHRGNKINYLGYVQNRNLLENWVNYETLINK